MPRVGLFRVGTESGGECGKMKGKNMKTGKISYVNIVISVNDDGYLAECPEIQGAFAEGDTIEEAVFNCIDVFKMIAEYRKERSEKIGISELDVNPGIQISIAMPLSLSA